MNLEVLFFSYRKEKNTWRIRRACWSKSWSQLHHISVGVFSVLASSSFLIPIIPATLKHQHRRRGKSPFLIHTITLLHTNRDIFPLCWKKQILFTWPLFGKTSLDMRTNKCWHMNAGPIGDDKVYITVTSYTGEKHSEHTQLTFPFGSCDINSSNW